MEKQGYPHLNPPPYSAVPPQPMHAGPPPTVVTSVFPTPVGPSPVRTTCPSCRAQILTRMSYEATTRTHLMCLLLCCLGLWPCACLPYCVDSCQNANHYCPNCDAFIGTYTS